MSTKEYTCSKCTKRLANRHSLCHHKKNCQSRSVHTHFDFNDAPESAVRSEGWEIPILNKRSEAIRSGNGEEQFE